MIPEAQIKLTQNYFKYFFFYDHTYDRFKSFQRAF